MHKNGRKLWDVEEGVRGDCGKFGAGVSLRKNGGRFGRDFAKVAENLGWGQACAKLMANFRLGGEAQKMAKRLGWGGGGGGVA